MARGRTSNKEYDPCGIYEPEPSLRRRQLQNKHAESSANRPRPVKEVQVRAALSRVELYLAFYGSENIEGALASAMEDKNIARQLDGETWEQVRKAAYRKFGGRQEKFGPQPGEPLN